MTCDNLPGKMGLAGVEPAIKRIQAQLLFGCNLFLFGNKLLINQSIIIVSTLYLIVI